MLSLSQFESSVDTDKDKKKLSAKGILQYQPQTFEEEMAVHGPWIARSLKNYKPRDKSAAACRAREAGARLSFLLKYVSSHDGKLVFKEEMFKEEFGGNIKKSFYNLRTDKKRRVIPLLLAAKKFKKQLPKIKDHLNNEASPFVQELTQKYGLFFLCRLEHNFGETGRENITSEDDIKCKTAKVLGKDGVGEEIAAANKCKKVLGAELEYRAVADYVMRNIFKQKLLKYTKG
jgi:hypothetical protein